MLQDLNVIAAMRGSRSEQVEFVTETLYSNYRTNLSRDGVLSMVLLLMNQRWDLRNFLRERVFQGYLSGLDTSQVFSEVICLLDQFSEVQQCE